MTACWLWLLICFICFLLGIACLRVFRFVYGWFLLLADLFTWVFELVTDVFTLFID